ncbi:hypothetical protein C4D60_Mb01t03240 [Musa balbisiana]|uniref:UBC core domain-containing protein n=1 Tax=Musa balbisiana TaxID=52838 RepID=A0A4S8JJI2_MUSBA|nr:hypothetical protein C4D60_Mb01t03240 [Musa balbisiana]
MTYRLVEGPRLQQRRTRTEATTPATKKMMVVIKNPIGRPFLPYDSISSSAASCPLFSDRPTRMWVLKSQMAQAARLNLRLQKELKLLVTDPPHGVSLPSLSDNPNLPSVSLLSIEAQIEGPEETVYSKGIFTVKIQGAWQPSMNILTVLTSIRLLLSEPNPDDALMAETSREFKYNKHVFDQKARTWTERYANPGSTGRSSDHALSTSLNVAPSEHIHEIPANEIHRRHKKLRLTCQDLSANPTTPTGISNNDENQNVVPTQRRSVSDRQQTSSSRFEWLLCASATVHKRSLDEQHAEEAVKDDPKRVEPSPEFLETIIVSDSEESDDEDDPPSQFLRKKIV